VRLLLSLSSDFAFADRNEEMVGKAIRDSGIGREEIFVTTKMHPKHLKNANAYDACVKSLERLGLEYVDLYLIHWPGAAKTPTNSELNPQYRVNTWKEMERLYNDKKCRSIGVSNFEVSHLEELLKVCTIKPQLNQFELHPMLPNKDLVELCSLYKIAVQAYCSLGQGEDALITNSVVLEIAKTLGKTPAQVLLKWAILKGYMIIPKTVNKQRMAENRELFGWEFSSEVMEKLDSIHSDCVKRFAWDPTKIR
jgi:diketogulonate reductase-like aldo/keto reductase